MGAVRRLTGVTQQAEATQNQANAQVAATEQASQAAATSLRQSAKAAADQQRMLAARSAAEAKASEAVSRPLETAEVQVDEVSTESSASGARRKRARFGTGYTSGVSV